tara:strand:- start:131 stop:451 length:321 start_codon:yes stop_codon:yes gene_type:complete
MNIGELKKLSDLSYNVSISKRNELEKLKSRQIIVYQEHIFRADPQTINLVQNLIEHSQGDFVILDTNDNPVMIKEGKEFLQLLITRNQESLNSYLQIHKQFAKKGE